MAKELIESPIENEDIITQSDITQLNSNLKNEIVGVAIKSGADVLVQVNKSDNEHSENLLSPNKDIVKDESNSETLKKECLVLYDRQVREERQSKERKFWGVILTIFGLGGGLFIKSCIDNKS